jgi:hypothetical protein
MFQPKILTARPYHDCLTENHVRSVGVQTETPPTKIIRLKEVAIGNDFEQAEQEPAIQLPAQSEAVDIQAESFEWDMPSRRRHETSHQIVQTMRQHRIDPSLLPPAGLPTKYDEDSDDCL